MIAQTDLFVDLPPSVELRERTLKALEALEPLTHRNASDTELLAAARAAEGAPSLRVLVLYLVAASGSRGITADRLIEVSGKRPYSVRPRLTELKGLGLVEDSGVRRANRFSSPETVWRATPSALLCATGRGLE